MATKSSQDAASTEQIEELLDAVDSTLDRLKTLYEQYFLGIQKQAPAFMHSDVERKLRDLTQINIRNTGLRYRLATLQQKFGSYNSYWRRTLRQIENGKYVRNLAKIGREAARTGSEIPEEILAAMPKRMREQVLRDRDAALAIAKRRQQVEDAPVDDAALDEMPTPPPAEKKTRSGAHVIDEADANIDFNEMFAAFDDDAPKEIGGVRAHRTTVRPQSRPQMPRMPLPTEAQQTTVLPKSSVVVPPAQTTLLPRVDAPPTSAEARATPSSGIPRPVGQQASAPTAIPRPVGQQPSAPAGIPREPQHTPSAPVPAAPTMRITPSAGVPRAVGQQASAPIPSPVGQQPSSPANAIPRPVGQQPSSPIPRPVGQQPSAPAAAIPRPVAGQPPSGAVPRPAVNPPSAGIPRPQGQYGSGPVQQPGGSAVRATPDAGPSRPTPAGVPPPPTPRTGPVPVVTQPIVKPPGEVQRPTQPGMPPVPAITQAIPRPAPSQQSRPIPIVPGAAQQTGPVPVESMQGPFPRTPVDSAQTSQLPKTTQLPRTPMPQPQRTTQAIPKPTTTQAVPKAPTAPAAPLRPPPGMTEADVNALHAKYVKAKEMVGEKVEAGSREKLLKTINQTAPKIMEQYQAKSVDFSVVVKDNQVIIKAKPKT